MIDQEGLSFLWGRVSELVRQSIEEYDSLAIATPYERGQVRPDNRTIVVRDDGMISTPADTAYLAAQVELLRKMTASIQNVRYEDGILVFETGGSYEDGILGAFGVITDGTLDL